MQHRKLGTNGPNVSAIGLGCMSFAGAFGETDEATSLSSVSSGTNVSWRVVSDNSGVDTILISDGANVNVALRSDQMTTELFEDDAAGTLVVAQSNDGSKIL